MDDPRFLRVILFGLVLTALVVGYLIFSGKFLKPQVPVKQNVSQTQSATPAPSASSNSIVLGTSASPVKKTETKVATGSAYSRLLNRAPGDITTLPKTGLPTVLIGAGFLSAIVSGWFLRKFPE